MKLSVRDVCGATGGNVVQGCLDDCVTSVSIDSRIVCPGALFVPLSGSRVDGHAYLEAATRQGAAAFLCRHDHHSLPAAGTAIVVDDPLTALQRLSAWYRLRLAARVVGVAGSNGKTTVKELLAQVCAVARPTHATRGNLNNHIGLPLTLLGAEEDVEILVVELGTSGAGELSVLCDIARPQIGVITSISEEHTETLNDLTGVVAAETELIAALPADGVAIVNGDDGGLVEAVRRRARCRVVSFGEHATNQIRVTDIHVSRDGTRCLLRTPDEVRELVLSLPGTHFALAAAAVVAAAAECGIGADTACTALKTARGAPHRTAVVNVSDRLTVIDDCYNANPASMHQAVRTAGQIQGHGERLLLVLGDMLELGTLTQARHEEVGRYLTRLARPPDQVVTVGEEARRIAEAPASCGIPVRSFASVEPAAAFVANLVRPGPEPWLVLVKGSRGVRLEHVVRHVSALERPSRRAV